MKIYRTFSLLVVFAGIAAVVLGNNLRSVVEQEQVNPKEELDEQDLDEGFVRRALKEEKKKKKGYHSPRREGEPCKDSGKSRCHDGLVCVEGKCRDEDELNDDEDPEGCEKIIKPVCVGGDTTYENECLAIAQGETDYEEGPCKGQKKEHFHGSDLKISKYQVNRFKKEGYKLLGQVELSKIIVDVERGADDDDDIGDEETRRLSLEEKGPGEGDVIKVHLVTPDGLHYVQKNHRIPLHNESVTVINPPTDHVPPMMPGFEGYNATGDGGRRLNAHRVSDTTTLPYRRIGELDSSGILSGHTGGFKDGGCSGTIIAKDKVLTAAHCVYNTYYNKWDIPTHFAPGRDRKCNRVCYNKVITGVGGGLFGGVGWAVGKILEKTVEVCNNVCMPVEPYGKWQVRGAQIYDGYIKYKPGSARSITPYGTTWDIAVLHMKPRGGVSIGDYLGVTTMVPQRPCINRRRQIDPNSKAAGYPGSRAHGEMWSTGKCSRWMNYNCGRKDDRGRNIDRCIDSHCRSAGGQSGSGLLDSEGQLFGVLSAGWDEGKQTAYCGLEQWMIDDILTSAGKDKGNILS